MGKNRYPFLLTRLKHVLDKHVAILLLLTGVGFCLRLYGIDTRSWWYDEMYTWRETLTDFVNSTHPPLPWILHFIFLKLFGYSLVSFRIVSAIFGSLATFFAYFLGKEIGGKSVGILSSVLMVVSPSALYFSQEVRPYALFQLIVILILLCLIRVLKNGKTLNWLLYGLSIALGFLVHQLTLFVITSTSAFALLYYLKDFRKKGLVRPLFFLTFVTLFGTATGFAWLLFPSHHFEPTNFQLPPFILFIWFSVQHLGVLPYIRLLPLQSFWVTVNSLLLLVLCVMGIAASLREKREWSYLLIVFLLVPLALTYFTIGEKWQWANWDRYISYLVAPYLVCIAFGVISIVNKIRIPQLRYIVLFVMPFLFLPGLWFWHGQAPTGHAGRFPSWAKQLTYENTLKGVLFDNFNVVSIMALYRNDSLPTFHLSKNGQLFSVSTNTSQKFPNVSIPQRHLVAPNEITSGTYALVSRYGRSDCSILEKHLGSSVSLTRQWTYKGIRYCKTLFHN